MACGILYLELEIHDLKAVWWNPNRTAVQVSSILPESSDHKVQRLQQCDNAIWKANVVLDCGLTTDGFFFFLSSFGNTMEAQC